VHGILYLSFITIGTELPPESLRDPVTTEERRYYLANGIYIAKKVD
jgi:hypothetical protein